MKTLLTPEQLAALLQVHIKTLNEMQKDGTIPAPIMLGKRTRRWDAQVIEDFLRCPPSAPL